MDFQAWTIYCVISSISTVQAIQKNELCTSSMSYFLTTSLIKIRYVCEMCLIRLYSEFLFSHDLQMGFKNSIAVLTPFLPCKRLSSTSLKWFYCQCMLTGYK